VVKQAAYMDVFLGIGLFFLVCVPFVLILKPSKNKVDISHAAH
jgi:DHA2 family multidrug resistance protein